MVGVDKCGIRVQLYPNSTRSAVAVSYTLSSLNHTLSSAKCNGRHTKFVKFVILLLSVSDSDLIWIKTVSYLNQSLDKNSQSCFF